MADETNTDGSRGGGFRFRDTTRAPLETTVRLRFDRLGGAVTAESADISMEGMFVKTAEPRPVGTLVQFEFDVLGPTEGDAVGASPTGEVVQGLGDVVWVRANGGPSKPSGMGIQFRYVDAQSREHVARIVGDFVRKISGGSEPNLPPVPGPALSETQLEESSPQGTLDLGTGGEPPGIEPTKTALLSQLPGWESPAKDELAVEAPQAPTPEMLSPPLAVPEQTEDGPFGALLASEPEGSAVESATVVPMPGRGVPTAPGSGSFSLSVPQADNREEKQEETHEPVNPAPQLLGGGEALSPATDPKPLVGGSSPEFPETPVSPLHEVEPYQADAHEIGSYYSGSTRTKDGSSWRSLAGAGIVLTVLALSAYFLKPWQYLPSSGESQEVDAGDTSPERVGAAVVEGEQLAMDSGIDPNGGDGSMTPAEEISDVDSEPTLPSSDEPPPETEDNADREIVQPDANPSRSEESAGGASAERRLVDLAAADLADRTQVRLVTSRSLDPGEFSFLSLASPPRFVLKIQEVEEPFVVRTQSVRFRRVRTGVHQVRGRGELHLVFDMVSPDFQAEVRLDHGELLITLR